MSQFGLPGVQLSAQLGCKDPNVVVIGGPKSGKSCLTTTLFDWPNAGDRPFALVTDKTGIDACAAIGYAVQHWKIEQLPEADSVNGAPLWKKWVWALQTLESNFIGRKPPYTSIVVDDASTMTEAFFTAYSGMATLQRYGRVLEHSCEIFARLATLGVPIIWYGWWREEQVKEEGSKAQGTYRATTIEGGLLATGNFKTVLPGKVLQVFILEARKCLPKDPNAAADGYERLIHTKSWRGIRGGGRYLLPEPMPANLGLALAYLTGMVPNPAQSNVELKR